MRPATWSNEAAAIDYAHPLLPMVCEPVAIEFGLTQSGGPVDEIVASTAQVSQAATTTTRLGPCALASNG
jgi:hypothetical protein